MDLHNLPKTTTKSLRRIGRGHGSGRVKTSGRGTKGQKARRDIKLHFEGGALPLIKRLPFLKGKGRNNVPRTGPVVVNVRDLNELPAKSIVDIELLVKHKLAIGKEAKLLGVKILGDGELTQVLTVNLPVSKSAKEKIEKAGGSVTA